MNTRTTLAALTLTATTLALGGTAAANQATCVVTAQPFNLTSYHLAYTNADGELVTLIAHQDGRRLDPTDFDIPADFGAVYWATRRGVIDGPDSFYTVLRNAGGCTFADKYNGGHNNRPSVTIHPGSPASSTVPDPTTTTAAPTTTAPAPTSSTAPPTSTTVTLPPVTVTWTDELPPATFPPTLPEQPSTTLPDGLDLVELTPDPTPYTAVSTIPTPTLPATGVNSLAALGLGGFLAAAGAFILGGLKCRQRNPQHVATHQHERKFDAS